MAVDALLDPPGPNQQPGQREMRRRIVLVAVDEPSHRGGRRLHVPSRGEEVGGALKSPPPGGSVNVSTISSRCATAPPMSPVRISRDASTCLASTLDGSTSPPQACCLERFFLFAREHRELRRPRCDARVPGLSGDVQIVLERERHIAAMAGELSDQQLVEHMLVQTAAGRESGAGAAGIDRGPPRGVAGPVTVHPARTLAAAAAASASIRSRRPAAHGPAGLSGQTL